MSRSTDWAHGFSSDTSLLFVVPNWFVTAVLVWQVTQIFLNVTSASTCKRINTNKLSKWELWDQNFNKTSHDVRLYPQKMDAICMMYTQRHLTGQLGQAEAAQQGKAVLQLWAPDSSPFLGWAPLCKLALCMHLNVSVWDNLWQGNTIYKVCKPQSCQTTGHKHHWWSSSHPHCIREICPYYLWQA